MNHHGCSSPFLTMMSLPHHGYLMFPLVFQGKNDQPEVFSLVGYLMAKCVSPVPLVFPRVFPLVFPLNHEPCLSGEKWSTMNHSSPWLPHVVHGDLMFYPTNHDAFTMVTSSPSVSAMVMACHGHFFHVSSWRPQRAALRPREPAPPRRRRPWRRYDTRSLHLKPSLEVQMATEMAVLGCWNDGFCWFVGCFWLLFDCFFGFWWSLDG